MKNQFVKNVLILAGMVVLVWFLWQIRSVIVYMILASILALIGSPVTKFLDRIHIRNYRFPHTFSVVITLCVFLLFIAGFVFLFVPLISAQADHFSAINAAGFEKNLEVLIANLSDELIRADLIQKPLAFNASLLSYLDLSTLSSRLNTVFSTVGSAAIGLVIVLYFTFFLLMDSGIARRVILAVTPDNMVGKMSNAINNTHNLITRYILGLLGQQSIVFVLYLALLPIIGMQNFVIIALIAAILNIVPYVGPIISLLIMIVLMLLNHLGGTGAEMLTAGLKVAVCYGIVQAIDNFVSQPLIFSKSLKTHPLEIFTVVTIGGTLFGIIGMVAAVPTYGILRIILKEFLSDYKFVQALTRNM